MDRICSRLLTRTHALLPRIVEIISLLLVMKGASVAQVVTCRYSCGTSELPVTIL